MLRILGLGVEYEIIEIAKGGVRVGVLVFCHSVVVQLTPYVLFSFMSR